MERLNFRIPEFVRVAWATREAEQVWAPIVTELSSFFLKLERLTLNHGLRKAIIQNVSPSELLGVSKASGNHIVIPLDRVNNTASYQSSTGPLIESKPWSYRCVIGESEIARELSVYYDLKDWDKVGELLGYPVCCRKFFMQYWVKEQWFDTTYPMGIYRDPEFVFPFGNILLRWLGIRLVSHLPCSNICAKTLEIGSANLDLAILLGFKKQAYLIMDLLNMPIEWSSLHGIAIITTPIFKIITASDALAEKATKQINGPFYPLESGTGNTFPFKSQRQTNELKIIEKDTWTINGFSSKEAMHKAHLMILERIKEMKIFPKSIIDFGCGDGQLLNQLNKLTGCLTFGVDTEARCNPDWRGNLYDFDAWPHDFDLALVAAQRYKEYPERFKKIEAQIRQRCHNLCIYDYDTMRVTIMEIQRHE